MFRLPEITYPLSINTIGKALAMGHEASVNCLTTGCNHAARLNLVALGKRLGLDHSCLAQCITPHFYCPKCRTAGRPDKRVGMILHTMSAAHSAWPREREEWRARGRSGRAPNKPPAISPIAVTGLNEIKHLLLRAG